MKVTRRQLRRIIKEEKARLLTEQADTAAAGLQAVADIYDAIDRLTLAIKDTQKKSGGMDYDSMDLALRSLGNMKAAENLDRIKTRLERIED
jgi:hypothetical protein